MRSQLGVKEQPAGSNQVPYSAWYGVAAPWCQMFQNWAHVRLGMVPPGFVEGTVPKGSAYTPTCADWFSRRGRWSTRPQVGALVYYDFPNDGVNRISHVGWVEAVNADGSITAIEGNTDAAGSRTGGQVMRKVRRSGIVGYGMPDYEEDALTGEDRQWIANLLVSTLRAAFAAPWDTETVGAAQHRLQQLLEEADATDDRILAAVEQLAKGTVPATIAGTFTLTGAGTIEGGTPE
jgi:surface antigen